MKSFVRTFFLILSTGLISLSAGLLSLSIATAQTPGPPSRASGSADAGSTLTPRIERLEEQLVDLQGTVAAVETLAKSSAGGGASGYSAAGSGASGDQIRQLSEQIADLTQRLERLETRLGGAGGAAPSAPRQPSDYSGAPPAGGFEEKQPLAPLAGQPQAPDRFSGRQAPPQPQTPPFGTAVETRPPSPQRPTAALTDPPGGTSPPPSRGSAPSPATASSGPARSLYDQGVSSFNRREYSAAQTYFEQFLQQYPGDPLAGIAQYWYGEAAFVSGDYKSSADRFLKTFTNYPNIDKAPEALLKLAISLRRLNENSAACDSFAELQRRFPNAPDAIVKRAESEKRRANCT